MTWRCSAKSVWISWMRCVKVGAIPSNPQERPLRVSLWVSGPPQAKQSRGNRWSKIEAGSDRVRSLP